MKTQVKHLNESEYLLLGENRSEATYFSFKSFEEFEDKYVHCPNDELYISKFDLTQCIVVLLLVNSVNHNAWQVVIYNMSMNDYNKVIPRMKSYTI